jgi:surface protein
MSIILFWAKLFIMKKINLLLPLFLITISVDAQSFITTWKTDNPGTSNATSITIPTMGGGYNYDVDWNDDGVFEEIGITGNVTHDFGAVGTYTIRIQGTFPRIFFNDSGDKSKILSVDNWGTNPWASMIDAFYGCNNLVINATDTPNLASVTATFRMFRGASSLGGGTGNWNWDVSNVTDMSLMFGEATAFNGDISGWNTSNVTGMLGMFADAISFNQNIGNWDVHSVNNMFIMFFNAPSFNQDISSWDVSNVVTMRGMFRFAASFNQNIGGWDVHNVTTLRGMFADTSSFDQDISGWDVSNVAVMRFMFSRALSFNQDLGNWNTSNVTDMGFMFRSATSFDQDISAWDVSNVTIMEFMFQDVTLSPINYDSLLIGWNTQVLQANVNFDGGNSNYCSATAQAARANMIASDGWTITDGGRICSDAFITTWKTDNPGTSNATSITIPTTGAGYNYDVDWDNDGIFDEFGIMGNVTHDFTSAGTYTIGIQGTFPAIFFDNSGDKSKILSVENWGTNPWTSMIDAFWGCNNLVINALDTPDLSGVIDTFEMFSGASSLGGGTGNWNWDVSNVGAMGFMFEGATSFNQDIGGWDVGNVCCMTSMFQNATTFDQDIGGWNVSNVSAMNDMFHNATSFNQDIGGWDVSAIFEIQNMFGGATSFNQDLGSWDVSSVPDFDRMFTGAISFDQNIGGWNTSNATIMRSMFQDAGSFNGDISGWDTSNVTDMSFMFFEANSFNQDIGGWNTGSVIDMRLMFNRAIAFDQDIGGWDVSNVSTMRGMFRIATSFDKDISGWDTTNVTDMSFLFRGASSFNQDIGGWDVSNVTEMRAMFFQDTAFDQDIGDWDVSNVSDMDFMFDFVTLSTINYDSLLIGWDALSLQPNVIFQGGNSIYCSTAAQAARANMIASDGWIITDGGACLFVPDIDPLPDLTDECSVSEPTAPTANDGAITATTTTTFPITTQGITVITWTYDIGNGNTETQMQNVVIEDLTAPVLTVISIPIILFPPNHMYETIVLNQMVVSVSDNCTLLSIDDVYISDVSSDEEENAQGGADGNTVDDIVIASDCRSVQLRKERSGNGNGRVYTMHMAVEDGNGNTATASTQVYVPLNPVSTAIDDGMAYEEICGNGFGPLVISVINADDSYSLDVKFWPNPSDHDFNIKLNTSNYTNNVKIYVYDVNGRLLHSDVFAPQDEYRFGRELAAGIYFVNIQQADKARSVQVVKY